MCSSPLLSELSCSRAFVAKNECQNYIVDMMAKLPDWTSLASLRVLAACVRADNQTLARWCQMSHVTGIHFDLSECLYLPSVYFGTLRKYALCRAPDMMEGNAEHSAKEPSPVVILIAKPMQNRPSANHWGSTVPRKVFIISAIGFGPSVTTSGWHRFSRSSNLKESDDVCYESVMLGCLPA